LAIVKEEYLSASWCCARYFLLDTISPLYAFWRINDSFAMNFEVNVTNYYKSAKRYPRD
ncbi:hypothetical protein MKX03_014844, partial [Papaver bracteatum]